LRLTAGELISKDSVAAIPAATFALKLLET
jgi:hypothetical protein